MTAFVFPGHLTSWAGDCSECAETQYPKKRLSHLTPRIVRPHGLPLLVKLEDGYAAVVESDLPYQLIDWFWYEPMNNPDADLTRTIPELTAFARERGVRLLLWVDARDLTRQGVARP